MESLFICRLSSLFMDDSIQGNNTHVAKTRHHMIIDRMEGEGCFSYKVF